MCFSFIKKLEYAPMYERRKGFHYHVNDQLYNLMVSPPWVRTPPPHQLPIIMVFSISIVCPLHLMPLDSASALVSRAKLNQRTKLRIYCLLKSYRDIRAFILSIEEISLLSDFH